MYEGGYSDRSTRQDRQVIITSYEGGHYMHELFGGGVGEYFMISIQPEHSSWPRQSDEFNGRI